MNIREQMRAILIDWMIEVSDEFFLKRDTLYTAIDLLDRYISNADTAIAKSDLQLIGITSLFLSSKIEEVYVPHIEDFARSTDGAYSAKQIVIQEKLISQRL